MTHTGFLVVSQFFQLSFSGVVGLKPLGDFQVFHGLKAVAIGHGKKIKRPRTVVQWGGTLQNGGTTEFLEFVQTFTNTAALSLALP